MTKKKKVYVVGADTSVRNMFERNGWEVVPQMRYADLVQFTGGQDINPCLYDQVKHCSTDGLNPWRDKIEATIFNLCLQNKIYTAGICRGMQLINSLVGGSMWQDVDNHYGEHKVTCDFYKFTYNANSIHHQQIIPSNRAYVMAYAECSTRKEKMDNFGHLTIYRPQSAKIDPEVVLWEHARAFGVQWHPEYSCHKQKDLDEIYINYLNDCLFDD